MEFKLKIEPQVYQEIQDCIDFYNERRNGFGRKFWIEISKTFKAIRKNPYFQIRYANVRCVPLKKFPFMIHFTLDEKKEEIIIRSLINTYKNPDTTWIL